VLRVLTVLKVLVLMVLTVTTVPTVPSAQQKAVAPQLADVVRRVEAYVGSYGEKASIVVCTERYVQETSGTRSGNQRRTIVSDFAIVKTDPVRDWLGFRDVLQVDDKAVSDRQDRLAHLLMQGENGYKEALRISDEGARFNIGAMKRNFNVPTTALFYFTTENHDRFKFSKKRVDADGIWQIDFIETSKATLITTPQGAPVPSSGTIWVRATDGTVVRTLLRTYLLNDPALPGQRGAGHIDVTYRPVEALAMWLPDEMSEEFETSRGMAWNRVKGHAEYRDYRQFTTSARIK